MQNSANFPKMNAIPELSDRISKSWANDFKVLLINACKRLGRQSPFNNETHMILSLFNGILALLRHFLFIYLFS